MRHAKGWLAGLIVLSAGAAAGGAPAVAAPPKLCPEASASVHGGDDAIAQATKAALKVDGALEAGECLYPAKLMRYGSIDVLVTLAAAPGSLCHGCSAALSAYVFRRRPEGLALVSRFASFGEAGTNGDPGTIGQASIAGSDGFVVEHGGTFQGYTSTRLDFYLFKGGRLVHLRPTLELSASNAGAQTDKTRAVTVDGAWSTGAAGSKEVIIDYKVVKDGRSTTRRATWIVQGPVLSPLSGTVPPEFSAASGGG